jgi:hypothetical protein
MKLRDLPQPIRELAEKRIREQGFKPYDNMIASWFDWEKSEEGNEFWSEVYKGNFAPFYERYPEPIVEDETDQPKQYTLQQLRDEKIAVKVENKEQSKALGVKNFSNTYYWSCSKQGRKSESEWSMELKEYWSDIGFTCIDFSQVVLTEPKQEHNMTGTPKPNIHYKQTTIEPITVIQDWKLSFCLGRAIVRVLGEEAVIKPYS